MDGDLVMGFLKTMLKLSGSMLLAAIILLSCCYIYAQEENIAESFGLYSKAVEYYHKGNLFEAKNLLERAVQLDPRNEDAKVYLELVNAELKLRAQGMLGSYQKPDEFKRESEQPDEPVKPAALNTADNQPEEDLDTEEFVEETEPSSSEISGEYKMSLGFTRDDVIWKQANGDYNERNFRMIDRNFQQYNTYDTRVFDRVKVVLDTNKENNGMNFHSDITVDPWSFIGTSDKFSVHSAWGDVTEFQLKYWSNTNRTINETYYSLYSGNSFALPEIKVIDGKTVRTVVRGNIVNEFGLTDTLTINAREIDYTFQPVRELWFDFKGDNHNLKVFPFALEDQAYTSDDPLILSNHGIYWEASPWMDEWVPGHLNTNPAANDFWRGKWSNDLSSFTRDSDLRRLTALRGFTFQGCVADETELALSIASPKGLWDDYDSINSLPGAARVKTQVTDSLMIGLVDTFRFGYYEGRRDSYENVTAVDASYDLDDTTNIAGEFAASHSEYDQSSPAFKTEKNGSAGHIALKKETDYGKVRIALTHMDEDFDPPLANYRETRNDTHWGRHIYFKKPLESAMWGGSTLKYEDIAPFRIGDGVDIGRNALNLRLESKNIFDERMDNLIDYRYVRDVNNKYVEGVAREENTFRLAPEWTSKVLMLYHDLPKTKGGIDPISYVSDTGEYLKNTAIEDGKDPSLSTCSLGVEYAPIEWFSIYGVYENTNDSRFATGNHPNGLLNSTYFATETIEGARYRDEVAQLYKQYYFDLPPFDRFNIYRTGISLKPFDRLRIDLDYTKNDFKFAQGIDDNLNHFGAGVKYDFTKKLSGILKYTYSKAYDMFKLNTTGDLKYQGHHNIFSELDYAMNEDGMLVLQFGEGTVLSPVWSPTATPFGDFYPTLDTQHIVRVYYNGRF